MLSAAVIVFREVLEAALIVTILLAATAGVPGRSRWIGGGILAGVAGAGIVAAFAGNIASALDGVGQEVFNAAVLLIAVGMLAWHNIWMSQHARELVAHLRNVSARISQGSLPLYFLAVASGTAVMREGAEVVLFLYSVAAGGSSATAMFSGGLVGILAGVVTGALLYKGLLKIPVSHLFQVTGWLILLLAAGLAASSMGYLIQAGILPWMPPLWDTSAVLPEKSAVGQLLHILVGYQEQPNLIQVGAYISTLVVILAGMKWASRQPDVVTPATREA
ncbi:MAG: iron permease [Gammaproteobacteria bacterium]|nr:MAG: iron permease [Gammaproteobacteria bacterium]